MVGQNVSITIHIYNIYTSMYILTYIIYIYIYFNNLFCNCILLLFNTDGRGFDAFVTMLETTTQTKAIPLGIKENKYDINNKQIKNIGHSVQGLQESCKQLGLLPTVIKDDWNSMKFSSNEYIIIVTNVCGDGPYCLQEDVNNNKIFDIEMGKYFFLTMFYGGIIWCLQHRRHRGWVDAKKECETVAKIGSMQKKAIRTYR